jgi:hypothetical protein
MLPAEARGAFKKEKRKAISAASDPVAADATSRARNSPAGRRVTGGLRL